nr:unknown [Zea mays]
MKSGLLRTSPVQFFSLGSTELVGSLTRAGVHFPRHHSSVESYVFASSQGQEIVVALGSNVDDTQSVQHLINHCSYILL